MWVAPIALGFLIMFGIIPIVPTSSQSTLCVQSVVNLTPQATICPSQISYIDSALFATSAASNTGTWGSNSLTTPGLVTSTGGFLKVYYILASGTTLKAYSLKYNTLNPATPVSGLVVGADSYSTYFGSSQAGAIIGSGSRHFRASILDSAGTNSTIDFYFQLVPATESVTFQALDVSNPSLSGSGGVPLAGVSVAVSQTKDGLNYYAYASATTPATLNLPPGGYNALFYAPKGYATSATSPLCRNQWTNITGSTFTVGTSGGLTVSASFAKGTQSNCNTTVTITNPPTTTIIPPVITTQTVSLTSTTCSIPPGQSTYTCVATTTSTPPLSAGNPGAILNFGIGATLSIAGFAGLVRSGRKR